MCIRDRSKVEMSHYTVFTCRDDVEDTRGCLVSYHIPTKAMDCPVFPDRPRAVGEDAPGSSVLV